MGIFESLVLMLTICAASGQLNPRYGNYEDFPQQRIYPQVRSYQSNYPSQQQITFGEPKAAAKAHSFTTQTSMSKDINLGANDEEIADCIVSVLKMGANYLWEFAKNNAALHCKLGTAHLATKFDEYVTKAGEYTNEELKFYLKEIKGRIKTTFHKALSTCGSEITRFTHFFEYEVCVPCGFTC